VFHASVDRVSVRLLLRRGNCGKAKKRKLLSFFDFSHLILLKMRKKICKLCMSLILHRESKIQYILN